MNSYIKKFKKYKIERLLKRYDIVKYKINDDLTIDVDGDVDLYNRGFNILPIKFGRVTGSFKCGGNGLTSLEGCPHFVGSHFECNHNGLENLIGGPEEVFGDYNCSANALVTLEGIAAEIGGNLNCQYNCLTDLNISSVIGGNIYCQANEINPTNYNFYGECKGEIKIYFA